MRSLLALLILGSFPALAQDRAFPQFEVASIRPSAASPGGEQGRERVDLTANTVSIRNASINFLIQWAYDVKFYQVDGPEWMKDQRWDIQAKAESPEPEKSLRAKMQGLLADRFHLVLRTERRSRPIYVLIAGSGKNRLTQARPGTTPQMSVSNGDFVFAGVTMPDFAERLSDLASVDRPVFDRTGLAGAYNLSLVSAASAIRTGIGPSIFTAISELGLQLKPTDEPLDVLVVQSVSRTPTDN